MSEERVPPGLLLAVRSDLRPVRPLASPGRRALALAPIGLLLLVAMPALWGWRNNLSGLSLAVSWGLSSAQALVGLWIVGASLREAVPGRELGAKAVGITVAAALALFVGITLVTEVALPTVMPEGVWLRFAWECFEMAALSSLPALAAAGWLVSRALPTRPAIAGALYGLGAGVMADSGVRLFCGVSTPSHVLVAHGGAILALAILGAMAATLVENVKARRGRARIPPGAP